MKKFSGKSFPSNVFGVLSGMVVIWRRVGLKLLEFHSYNDGLWEIISEPCSTQASKCFRKAVKFDKNILEIISCWCQHAKQLSSLLNSFIDIAVPTGPQDPYFMTFQTRLWIFDPTLFMNIHKA